MFSALNIQVCFSVRGKGLFVTLTSKNLKHIISDANFNVQQLNRTKTFIFGESKIFITQNHSSLCKLTATPLYGIVRYTMLF